MFDNYPILLKTKLHRPPITRGLIARARLFEQLDRGINGPLTMVIAPAGFGKTTLVSTWIERLAAGLPAAAASFPVTWLSLDEKDSDLNLFLHYFIAALRTIFADACDQTLALLQTQKQPPQELLQSTLSNELEALPGEAILVLDDYHTLHGVDVHNLLGELVHHWPRPLHLVLISRLSPPIPLSSLRARGMLSEIRTRDLRFTTEEMAAYLSQTHFVQLSQNSLPLLEERFEGWPAGLHLAALSLRSESSQEAVLSALSSKSENITGYLVDEVLTRQFPAIQTFLLKTSILDRFCAPLCEAIFGEIDPAWNVRACLDWIERSELFLVPQDDRQVWYRYHHLFRDLLQDRLSAGMAPDEVADLHRRASAWFEDNGLIDEALQHALAAGDLDLVAHQMVAGLRDVLNRVDRSTLERWLRLLPEEMIQRRPGLLMIRFWVLEWTWQIDLQVNLLQQAEELLDSEVSASRMADDLQILRGQILLFRAQQAYFSNQTVRAIGLCRQALALLPPSWKFLRGAAMLYLGLSLQANGQALEAEQMLLTEYASCDDKNDIYALVILESLGLIYINTGKLEQARQIAQVLCDRATRRRLVIMKNWGCHYLGLVCYQRNELRAAAHHFNQIVEDRYAAQITTYRDAVAGLAIINQIQGKSAEAWQMVESISQFDLEQSGSEDERTRSLRARLMILQGDLESAGRWADTFTGPPPEQTLLWLEEPQVTRARVLVARGANADLQLAHQILDTLEDIAERIHNTRYQIELLALRALALDAQGKTGPANAALKRALDLARPGRFIRVFADLGNPMQKMLRRLPQQDHGAEMIHPILAAFPDVDQHPHGSASGRSLGIMTLAEPLTPRELEVLALLREPSSIQEIALQLNITYATAKRHTINIYGKLGVNRRRDAVAKAEELSILPPAGEFSLSKTI